MTDKKLLKDRSNQMICGVCAGIGKYLGIDPTLIRLAWIALSMIGGSGIFAYIVAAIVIPDENRQIEIIDEEEK